LTGVPFEWTKQLIVPVAVVVVVAETSIAAAVKVTVRILSHTVVDMLI
jgi:hypothetical protein